MASVLPNIHIPSLDLGPFDLQPFGVLVAVGVLYGAHVVRKYGEKHDLDFDAIQSAIGWVVVCGFLGAHWFDVLFYQPGAVAEDPLILIKFWAGISSFGGFIGGFAGWLIYFFIRERDRNFSKLRYADAFMLGLMPGFAFGRVGCTIVFDHPGTESSFFLAMEDRAGIARHNLGLYELLLCIVIVAVLFLIARRKDYPRGLLVGVGWTIYGPVRFLLDFLRISEADGGDERYFGMTFAHYTSLGVTAIGLGLLWYVLKHRNDPEPVPVPAGGDDDDEPAARPARKGPAKGGRKKGKKKRK